MLTADRDPVVCFLYELLEHGVPLGDLLDYLDLAVSSNPVEPREETLAIAERLAGQLAAARDSDPEPDQAFAGGVDRIPPPNGAPVISPPMAEHRTALDSIDAVMSANPGRWLKLKQIHTAAGGEQVHSFTAFRQAMQRYVREERAEARGATAARVYCGVEKDSTGSAEQQEPAEPGASPPEEPANAGDDTKGLGESSGVDRRYSGDGAEPHEDAAAGTSPGTAGIPPASQGSSDQHAGTAGTLPPRSPSSGGGDESPDGGGEEDEASPSPTKRRRRKMAEAPRRPLPKPPPMEPIRTGSANGNGHSPKPDTVHSISYVINAISPWLSRQQTFRKRQLVEAYPHFTPDEIRPALTALGVEGKLTINASGPGEPVYTVVGREDRGGEAKPAAGSTGTIEGAILQFVSSKGSRGANLGAVATAAQLSNDDAATTLSKLWREGDVRVTTVDGDRVYVAA